MIRHIRTNEPKGCWAIGTTLADQQHARTQYPSSSLLLFSVLSLAEALEATAYSYAIRIGLWYTQAIFTLQYGPRLGSFTLDTGWSGTEGSLGTVSIEPTCIFRCSHVLAFHFSRSILTHPECSIFSAVAFYRVFIVRRSSC